VAYCVESHEVLYVKQEKGESFVVLDIEDWRAIEETLFLNKILIFVLRNPIFFKNRISYSSKDS